MKINLFSKSGFSLKEKQHFLYVMVQSVIVAFYLWRFFLFKEMTLNGNEMTSDLYGTFLGTQPYNERDWESGILNRAHIHALKAANYSHSCLGRSKILHRHHQPFCPPPPSKVCEMFFPQQKRQTEPGLGQATYRLQDKLHGQWRSDSTISHHCIWYKSPILPPLKHIKLSYWLLPFCTVCATFHLFYTVNLD